MTNTPPPPDRPAEPAGPVVDPRVDTPAGRAAGERPARSRGMAILLLSATLVIVGNLIADLLYVLVDPRVRLERSSS